MAPEKVTKMVLNVDLKCSACYKKVKKIICKIPQIRDQEFDVDKNKVKITVICCSPEKIRDKICYKGGRSIQSIEILEKPKETEKSKPKDEDKGKPADKPKDAEKGKTDDKPKDSGKPKEAEKPKDGEKPKGADKPPKGDAPKKPDAGPKPDVAKMMMVPVHGYPHMYPPAYPMVGYGQYYEGYGGGPFQHEYGMPVAVVQPPLPPPGHGYGYEYGYHENRSSYVSGDYFSEENPQGCSIM